jgi:hypothetical protein
MGMDGCRQWIELLPVVADVLPKMLGSLLFSVEEKAPISRLDWLGEIVKVLAILNLPRNFFI